MTKGKKIRIVVPMEKIVFFEIEEWEEPYFRDALGDCDVTFTTEKLRHTPAQTARDATIISTFINSTLDKDMLSQLPNLQLLITRSVGYDHIDLAYCKERNITVCNIPTYGVHTIAEHAFSLMLALSRNLIPSVEQARRGDFRLEGLRGFELYNKTLGVIGVGHIGSVVIKIAQGFGMKVVVYSHHSDPELEKQGVRFISLDELLSVSDIITIHVPFTKETEHLINVQNITKCKKGSILINTARGGIVETQALVDGLEKGILSGAGLDVLEEECYVKEEHELLTSDFITKCDLKTQLLDHILLERDDVIITPHNAFNSTEALQQIMQTTIDNIKGFMQGNPQNVVG